MSYARDNIHAQLEHLQSKYVGTGHADTSKFEWNLNIHRDSYASYIGHHSLLSYFAIAENVACGRYKYELLQKMYQPCGVPPPTDDD
jgi:splicing factor 3B subunit 5